MRTMKIALRGLAALLAALGLAAAVYVWRAFPALDGELKAPGLAASVQVRRDASDVTHIEAKSVADAYFALGYVHAQERGWQLEFNRRVMHGELSEVFGPATLETDRTLRKLGVMRAAQAQYERLPLDAQALLQAYARGIDAFHATSSQALPPEFHILGVRPGAWTPQDSVAWVIMMGLDLSGNWGTEFTRLSLLQRLDTAQLWELMPPYPGEAPATAVDLAKLYRSLGVYRAHGADGKTAQAAPLPEAVAALPQLDAWTRGLGDLQGVGSNDWVIAGSHTASGKPIVANDPHLGLSAPAIWYFARLKAPAADGRMMDVIGATFPGLPSVVLGRTADVAWGFTNTGPDVQDLYLEQINPDNPRQYRTPTGWADFETREEIIHVKGHPDEKLVVRSTRHGPVMSDANAAYETVVDTKKFVLALRWTALDADNQTVLGGLRANLARNVDELLAGFALYHTPTQNMVAADTQGRTVYRAIGRIPLRAAGNDIRGIAPAPGWEAKYDWSGWVPASEVPGATHADIAAKGWYATANQRVAAPDYPYFIGQDWVTPERFDRIEALLAATPKHDFETVRAIQADTLSLATMRLLPVLRQTASSHPLAAAAQAELKTFDGNMRSDSAAAAIFAYWADEITRGLVMPKIGEARFNAMYGKRTFRAGIERMLLDPKVGAWWCGPTGCAGQSSRALGAALDRLSAQQGGDVAVWRWGRSHPALSAHRPFDNVAALARFFDVSVPSAGDPWTVNVGQYWAGEARLPFATRHGPSLRAIYDLADPEKSRFIYQTGQSGLVFSSRYDDMSEEWAQARYRPLRMKPQAWVHEATLVP
ncbi:MAG TPA: penicillin acylase family protein [Ramlibacter sp.]|uniref:penicillin acylase family protein n=1 Tax=Ramlibacter sp. TaxID=1917967 RepID=UPI002CC9FD87|nr:penicillin acylase family protein [Ramlibacter sp.]HVZ45282.1 penicillin acylase family protein [Ramlibacter sp.]